MKLYNHQQGAIKHLREWKVGALFMEAGTGKTAVAVELVSSVPDTDLVVWIGPLRTIRTQGIATPVSDEVRKAGGFNCESVFIGVESISASSRIFNDLYEKMSRAGRVFMVVDESLKIKNADALRTRRILELGKLAEYRLILNGTPLSRNLLDLWPQMEFLSPSILNMSLARFKNTFCRYTVVTKMLGGGQVFRKEQITGVENVDYLHSLIRQYVYCCDLNLNITRNYEDVRYNIEPEEREEYDAIKERYLKEDALLWQHNIFLELTQKMQHSYCICEGKMAAMDKLFRRIPQSRTIIFTKFVSSADACRKRYPDALVLSYQKNALGLNLQEYNHTVFFDKIWDYALRDQGAHRTFRTGQEQECHYYDLTGNVGLESMIDRCIAKKTGLTEYFKTKTKQEIMNEL